MRRRRRSQSAHRTRDPNSVNTVPTLDDLRRQFDIAARVGESSFQRWSEKLSVGEPQAIFENTSAVLEEVTELEVSGLADWRTWATAIAEEIDPIASGRAAEVIRKLAPLREERRLTGQRGLVLFGLFYYLLRLFKHGNS